MDLDDPIAKQFQMLVIGSDIKSIFLGAMECAEQYEPFCFKTELGVQHQEVDKNWGHLCTLFILNVSNSIKPRVMRTMKTKVFYQDDMSVSDASFLRSSQLYYDKATLT